MKGHKVHIHLLHLMRGGDKRLSDYLISGNVKIGIFGSHDHKLK